MRAVSGYGPPLTESELIAAYGPAYCMTEGCEHVDTAHEPDGCSDCPCRGFDPQGPPDPYDVARDAEITWLRERGL